MDNRYRILVVEKDVALLNDLLGPLKQYFDPVVADTPALACERFLYYETDLAIVDLGHSLEGLTVCQAIRGVPEGRQLPIIFLADTDDAETARKAYAAGCSLMLRKPVESTRLIRNVELSLVRLGPPRSRKNLMDSQAAVLPTSTPIPKEPQSTPVPVRPSPFAQPERSDVFIERSQLNKAEFHKSITPREDSPEVVQPAMARVMIVDDDPDTIELVQIAFQDQYELLAALDGLQALERIIEYEPDLIIVDIMMPKMNGFQLCHSLRRDPDFQNVPIVFLSAKSGRKDREYAFQCGATAYVTKPFDVKKLNDLIREITSKPEFSIRPKHFCYHDIHRRERELMREKEELLHDRERRMRYEQMKNFIKKNV